MTQQILFLADTAHPAKAVLDHIHAIARTSQACTWHVLNPLMLKTLDKLDWSVFDAVGIHYSIKPYNHYYLSKALKAKIKAFKGLKFQFLQDEYQQVNAVQEYLCDLDIHILFTLVSPQSLDQAYPHPKLKNLIKIPVLTAYASEYMKHISSKPIAQRTIDVSYRARRCEYWLGSLAFEKQFIADEFLRKAKNRGLSLNISLLESDRLYGEAWLDLLKNSKAVLGTESGASIWDFTGDIAKETKAFLKDHRQASFEETYDKVLKKYDNNLRYNAISPRIFEAAATRTPMILFPGEYNGICQPNRHYIPLEKDFSNFEEVLSKLQDTAYLEGIAAQAYSDLIASDLYSEYRFSQGIEEALLNRLPLKSQAKGGDIESDINKTLGFYKSLNTRRRLKTELHFIVVNFFNILCDGRTSFKDKIANLFSGLKRYFTYLIPKIKGSNS